MRSFLTLGAATIALAIAAPALAQTTAPAAPTQAPAAPAPAPTAAAPVAAGQPVKDNSGAVIGSVAEVKPDAAGKSMATIKMDDKTFAVDVANLAVRDGATLINASKAEIEGMLGGVKK
uniref:PRC-barrel domain-containing protein n=1 Tax=Caulobacter sp. (strain K31) TaxID=366602 RepID=B0T7U1_CAUSK